MARVSCHRTFRFSLLHLLVWPFLELMGLLQNTFFPGLLQNTVFPGLILGLILGVTHLATVHASGLICPHGFENTAVLPKEVGNLRFKNLFVTVNDKFNANGTIQPLGMALNQQVSWQQMIDYLNNKGAKLEAAQLEGVVRSNGMATDDGPGYTTGDVKTFTDVKVPILAYGVTDRWTLAIGVPIYTIDINAKASFVASDRKIRAVLRKTEQATSPAMAAAVRDKMALLDNSVNAYLESNGYEPLESMTASGLGDLIVMSKVLLNDSKVDTWALKNTVTLPTGTPPNADRVIDPATGDGQTDLGISLIHDHWFGPWWRWSAFGGYNLQFADSLERRIPRSSTMAQSPDKERVDRDLGDQVGAGTSLAYTMGSTGFSFEAGYNFQYQTGTSYRGTRFSAERYTLLENLETSQLLHSGSVGATFSTIEWFKSKTFDFPLQASVTYSRSLAGRNVMVGDTLVAEMALFF